MSCIECDRVLPHPSYKICAECKESVKVECACGCGAMLLKYHPKDGLRERKFIRGHKPFNRLSPAEQKHKVYQSKVLYRRNNKATLILDKGNMCMRCGILYDGSNACIFDFHHRDPDSKSFEVSCGRCGLDTLREEIQKCDLLCANCHRLEHSEEY